MTWVSWLPYERMPEKPTVWHIEVGNRGPGRIEVRCGRRISIYDAVERTHKRPAPESICGNCRALEERGQMRRSDGEA